MAARIKKAVEVRHESGAKQVPIPKKTKQATAATVLASNNSNTQSTRKGALNGSTI